MRIYQEIPMAEADIQKVAFHAGSCGLYEFTKMSFGLSNSESSFCHLIEMRLGGQQFVTLLLYLDDICIFAAHVNEMLDGIEMIFQRLHIFNLKTKAKKSHFFQSSAIFLQYVPSMEGTSADPEKWINWKNWLEPVSQLFLDSASYYRLFILNFTATVKCLHQLVGPTYTKKDKNTKAWCKQDKFPCTDK